MPTVLDSGTFDVPDGNENTVYTATDSKIYGAWINFDELDTGDTLVLRLKTKTLTGDSFDTFYERTFTGVDGGIDGKIFGILPTICPYGFTLTLQQTAGTLRDFKYQIHEPAG